MTELHNSLQQKIGYYLVYVGLFLLIIGGIIAAIERRLYPGIIAILIIIPILIFIPIIPGGNNNWFRLFLQGIIALIVFIVVLVGIHWTFGGFSTEFDRAGFIIGIIGATTLIAVGLQRRPAKINC